MPETTAHHATAPLIPVEVQTFSGAEDRIRLTPVALKAFISLGKQWGLSGFEAAALLGVSESTWDRIKRRTWRQPLSQDQLATAGPRARRFRLSQTPESHGRSFQEIEAIDK